MAEQILNYLKKIAFHLGQELGKVSIKTFMMVSCGLSFRENIRGHDVFIIQSTNSPAENIIELTLMIDATVRASAKQSNNCYTILFLW